MPPVSTLGTSGCDSGVSFVHTSLFWMRKGHVSSQSTVHSFYRILFGWYNISCNRTDFSFQFMPVLSALYPNRAILKFSVSNGHFINSLFLSRLNGLDYQTIILCIAKRRKWNVTHFGKNESVWEQIFIPYNISLEAKDFPYLLLFPS